METIKPTQEAKKEELSGVTIVILIGASVMTFIILFIFAKRQIMRFTLRSRPWHEGHDVKKSIKREIERRLDQITKIAFEPTLIWEDSKYILLHGDTNTTIALPPYYYRQKAVDDVKILGMIS
jgi:NICE-3 protein